MGTYYDTLLTLNFVRIICMRLSPVTIVLLFFSRSRKEKLGIEIKFIKSDNEMANLKAGHECQNKVFSIGQLNF